MVSAVSLHWQGAAAVCNGYVCVCLLELSRGAMLPLKAKLRLSLHSRDVWETPGFGSAGQISLA